MKYSFACTALTVIGTAALVIVAPRLSVATAVRLYAPAATFVQTKFRKILVATLVGEPLVHYRPCESKPALGRG